MQLSTFLTSKRPCALLSLCAVTLFSVAQAVSSQPSTAANAGAQAWTQTFGDVQGPLYLTATYTLASGQQGQLEFWRGNDGRVVRRTGNRAELRLTPAADGEDQYQLRNLQRRVAYNVHRTNLYRLGVLTDRWSVQHLLDRPNVPVKVRDLAQQDHTKAGACHWYQMQTSQQQLDICWSAPLGVPLKLRAGTQELLNVQQVKTQNIQFPLDNLPTGWHDFNTDEDIAPD